MIPVHKDQQDRKGPQDKMALMGQSDQQDRTVLMELPDLKD